MNKIDYLSLDGRSIRTFLMVLEEGSVSKAARRLGITQSAVSHTLDKLREALGDELFVRAGRGIDATEHARALEAPARALLDDMKAMTDSRVFDPTSEPMSFTVAANDFQRDMIFPELVRIARKNKISLNLSFMPSAIPTAALLRESRCDLIVSPIRPDASDIYQTRLFDDRLGCCYDSKVWKKTPTIKQLQTADFVTVNFGEGSGHGLMPKALANKLPMITVPNFAGIVSFIEGTDLVSIQSILMGTRVLKPLTVSAAPFETQRYTMYMLWHRRNQMDPTHIWLRKQIQDISTSIESKTQH